MTDEDVGRVPPAPVLAVPWSLDQEAHVSEGGEEGCVLAEGTKVDYEDGFSIGLDRLPPRRPLGRRAREEEVSRIRPVSREEGPPLHVEEEPVVHSVDVVPLMRRKGGRGRQEEGVRDQPLGGGRDEEATGGGGGIV